MIFELIIISIILCIVGWFSLHTLIPALLIGGTVVGALYTLYLTTKFGKGAIRLGKIAIPNVIPMLLFSGVLFLTGFSMFAPLGKYTLSVGNTVGVQHSSGFDLGQTFSIINTIGNPVTSSVPTWWLIAVVIASVGILLLTRKR